MQPQLEKIPSPVLSSIAVKRERTPYMDYPLHYHPEHEIIYVQKSYGLRFMGNHIGNFTDGDLVFISSNLPHVWKNDQAYYQGNPDLNVDVYVIHFLESTFGNFFDLPEFIPVKNLFSLGQQGMLIRGNDKKVIANLIKEVYSSSGMDRLIIFLKTLKAIALSSNYTLLSGPGYTENPNFTDTERIGRVVHYCLSNYYREITLDQVAHLIALKKSSFCRYFKSRTRKTFTQFMNEIRITKACKLLVDGDMTVSEICYEVGYNNISHFNRQFRLITGTSAKEYVKQYHENLDHV